VTTVTIHLEASPAAIVTGIGACVVAGLDQTPAGAPCRQCLLLPTATIPWDGCSCDCPSPGQFAQAITQVGAMDATFSGGDTAGDWHKCDPSFTYVKVLLSVVRCVPVMDERGTPPGCADELAAAVTLENDRTALRQALACCINSLIVPPYPVRMFNIGPTMTVGEQGGCAGTETVYTLALAKPCICEQ
jgi:hypothetical protein